MLETLHRLMPHLLLISTGIGTVCVHAASILGLLILWSSLIKSKSKWKRRIGKVNRITVSANVLPKQTRLPPRNGLKVKGLRGLPLGVSAQGLLKSNLSGINLVGSYHYSGSWCIALIPIENASPDSKVIPFMVTVRLNVWAAVYGTGGSILKAS